MAYIIKRCLVVCDYLQQGEGVKSVVTNEADATHFENGSEAQQLADAYNTVGKFEAPPGYSVSFDVLAV